MSELEESDKRYLLRIAGRNLAVLMQKPLGTVTPRAWRAWSEWLHLAHHELLDIVANVITAARRPADPE